MTNISSITQSPTDPYTATTTAAVPRVDPAIGLYPVRWTNFPIYPYRITSRILGLLLGWAVESDHHRMVTLVRLQSHLLLGFKVLRLELRNLIVNTEKQDGWGTQRLIINEAKRVGAPLRAAYRHITPCVATDQTERSMCAAACLKGSGRDG